MSQIAVPPITIEAERTHRSTKEKSMNKNLKTLLAAFAVAALSLVSTYEVRAQSNQTWWPDQLDLTPLRQHSLSSNPMGEKFDYAKEFAKLDKKKRLSKPTRP